MDCYRYGKPVALISGKTGLLVDGYPYYRRDRIKRVLHEALYRWCCTKRGCKAYAHVIERDFRVLYVSMNIFMTSRGKERLVYHNYTYYKQSRTKTGFRWGCTKNRWHRCRAYLHLMDDMTIARSNLEHTHTPFGTPIEKTSGHLADGGSRSRYSSAAITGFDTIFESTQTYGKNKCHFWN
ncbi:unnamed protein product [Plutella xylostella]|uniref:(diamondback moth) hypothetical protein n=1 Tax=Plutella xylostella TaxID=51655 RepID=A0A8S4G619_PLUXY|nr:unnamed protein product [Plutella xylostella]